MVKRLWSFKKLQKKTQNILILRSSTSYPSVFHFSINYTSFNSEDGLKFHLFFFIILIEYYSKSETNVTEKTHFFTLQIARADQWNLLALIFLQFDIWTDVDAENTNFSCNRRVPSVSKISCSTHETPCISFVIEYFYISFDFNVYRL